MFFYGTLYVFGGPYLPFALFLWVTIYFFHSSPEPPEVEWMFPTSLESPPRLWLCRFFLWLCRFFLVLCCLYYNTPPSICQAFLLFIFHISFICFFRIYYLNFLCFCNAHCASHGIHRDFRNPGLHFRCKNNIMMYMWKDALRIVPYFVLPHLRWHSGRC